MLFRFGSYIQLSKVNKLGMGIKYIVMYNILFYDLLKGKQVFQTTNFYILQWLKWVEVISQ